MLHHNFRLFCLTLLACLSGFAPHTLAQNVTAANDGTGTTIDTQGNQFNIGGGSLSGDGQNLFHSLQQFGLDQNQIANFLSNPDIRNILTRVVGGDVSIINGLIQVSGGNANLFLMNPAGMIFGPNASINVPGDFVVTTGSAIGFGNDQWFQAIADNDYGALVGSPTQFAFDLANPGLIINAGDLSVTEGKNLTFLAGNVVNTGSLTAPGGNITVAAVPGQNRIRISQPGSLLSLEVEVSPQMNQGGSFSVLDLPTLLTQGAGNLDLGLAVQADGTVTQSATNTMVSPLPGSVTLSGTIDASNTSSVLAPGGQVAIAGDQIAVQGAAINVSGNGGGGTVRIGGDFQGQPSLPTAVQTLVDGNSVIKADGLLAGDGGTVIVWADDSTRFGGTISAQGGTMGGDGGFVETSGAKSLIVDDTARVNTLASMGETGTWLLDPEELIVGLVNNPGAEPSLISASTVEISLLSSNVVLQADKSIAVIQRIFPTGSSNNLTFDSPLITLDERVSIGDGSITFTNTGPINTGNTLVTSSINDLNFEDNVELNANTTFSAPGYEVVFFDPVNGNFDLLVEADGIIFFDGAGTTTPLKSIGVTITATTGFNSGKAIFVQDDILTQGDQIFDGQFFASGLNMEFNPMINLTSSAGSVIFTGDITLTDVAFKVQAAQNIISPSTSDLRFSSLTTVSKVLLDAGQNVSFGNINTNINTSGGNLDIQALGNISTGSIVTSPSSGSAGDVLLNAGGNLTTGYIETSGSNGGKVTLSSGGDTNTSYIDARGLGDDPGVGGLGGAVSIESIGGLGGAVSIQSKGDITTAFIDTGAYSGVLFNGTGGNVFLTADGNITTNYIFTAGKNGGDIFFQAGENVEIIGYLDTFGSETGGEVYVEAPLDISIGSYIFTGGDGEPGNVFLQAGGDITTGYIDTSAANGGDIFIQSGGDIEVNYLFTKGVEGTGGDVYVEAARYFRAIDGFFIGSEGPFSIYTAGATNDGGGDVYIQFVRGVMLCRPFTAPTAIAKPPMI
ncbi:two-partner secretion domain-containing protein [Synechocystis salina]|uniref:two-partner secretion domain-containing protein n=1 Tax=Synechocystis salina TaxID=945780 RepID=UPI002AD3452C|nr:filamentous hemagglutinin N-terminal domain-containing protein [Synechocystis salina]